MSIWLVPAGSVSVPAGIKPVSFAGRWLLGVACLAYGGGGILAYNELVVGVAVRSGVGLGVHIPQIWVDSKVSLEGGRALWGIPKELASFQKAASGWPSVVVDGEELASMEIRPRWPIPRRWKMKSRVVQARGDEVLVSRFRVDSHLAWSWARWHFSGPLAFLENKRPLVSIGLSRARLEFGG